MADVRALLIDIDGVLAVSWEPLEGAVDALRRIRAADLPFALVTNTTSRTRAEIAGTLADAGFPVEVDDVLTAPAATAEHLRAHHQGARVALLTCLHAASSSRTPSMRPRTTPSTMPTWTAIRGCLRMNRTEAPTHATSRACAFQRR